MDRPDRNCEDIVKVKTLRPHANGYGHPFNKRKGSIYVHPAPESLIRQKVVEPYAERETRRRKGSGKGAARPQDGDGKAGDAKGHEGSDGAGTGEG
ncbi:hypothetical protein GCM10007854_13440 [Algimonas porphyrae]|uniref:Uncharacterized protein n=1 Tax=Algimonas porphyrae TaxID=1128113 RepID=A0ABQ5UYL5_9PROT|nr:hypothetical protein GCM10007854_13440 [Algimonas porphyrae]